MQPLSIKHTILNLTFAYQFRYSTKLSIIVIFNCRILRQEYFTYLIYLLYIKIKKNKLFYINKNINNYKLINNSKKCSYYKL